MRRDATYSSGPEIGAAVRRDGTLFRVWAPDHDRLELVLEAGAGATPDDRATSADRAAAAGQRHDRTIPLEAEADGYHAAFVPDVGAGARYRFRLPDGRLAPDPASRYQPDGPHGASEVVDPGSYHWSDEGWTGVRPGRQVVYEMHIGTFTPGGTWRTAMEQLPQLVELGVTVLEVMPVAEFAGRFNWGYDGVAPFAPARAYGRPDDFRAFVDRAHDLGLAVILDVVYNHMGPDGCYMPVFARSYFSDRHSTDWGDAINFDGPSAAPVRHFFLANAEYWIREFHVDGYRVDATQDIHDDGTPHILAEITEAARAAAAPRHVWLVAENERQDTRIMRAVADGGHGFDAAWNDDFHHTARVALTGRTEAYYSDYRGTPQELVSAVKWGFLYQGQHYAWQRQRRGSPALDMPARCFVNYLQNHDQVANSADGRRLHALASVAEYRAITALLLLAPGHALLFQGQEFAASAPFLFFADHEPELARKVRQGRGTFMAQFPSAGSASVQERLADPADEATFTRSTLDPEERTSHHKTLALHRDLIRLSREDPVFAVQDAARVHGAILDEHTFVLRYRADDGFDRLLLVNLGPGGHMPAVPEPLLAPPAGTRWDVLWSSEDPAYGGQGYTNPEQDDGWTLPGRAAVVLAPAAAAEVGRGTGSARGMDQ
jgi:maltooligosyltrehalose trehalohydrolase